MTLWIDNPTGAGTVANPYRAPTGAVGSILDLRSIPQQATPNDPSGFIVYKAPSRLTAEARPLGNPDDTLPEQGKRLLESALGLRDTLQANRVADILAEIITDKADPTGDDRVKPLRGTIGQYRDLWLGGRRLRREKFSPKSPGYDNVLSLMRSEWAAERVKGETLTLMRNATARALKLRMTPEEMFPSHKDDDFRWPKTSYSDDFNRSNSATVGGSWAEPGFSLFTATGFAIESNQLHYDVGANADAGIRFNQDLSVDDMVGEVDIVSHVGSTHAVFGSILVRANSTNSMYMGGCYRYTGGAAQAIILNKYVSGTGTGLTNPTTAWTNGHLVVSIVDSQLTLAITTFSTTVTDTAVTGNLQSGLEAATYDAGSTAEIVFDNWLVRDVGAPAGGGGLMSHPGMAGRVNG